MPQSTVKQSTGPAGCPIGKIALIDHKHPVPGCAEVLCGAGTVNTGADNNNIKVTILQLGQSVSGC